MTNTEPGKRNSSSDSRRLLLATVFVTGAGVLVIELVGTRLIAPFFGSGIYTWSALIAVTLAALSLGYTLGGRLADRRPETVVLFALCLAAACWTLFTPLLAKLLLPAIVQSLELRLGVILASILLFFPNLCLLGTMGPFAIRLLMQHRETAGATSGMVFAVSTLGSLIAALATGFILVPNLGTALIFTATGIALWLWALFGGRRIRFVVIGALFGGAFLALALTVGKAGSQVASVELIDHTPSYYGDLHVVRVGDQVALLANGIGQNFFQVEGRWMTAYVNFLVTVPALLGWPEDENRTGLVVGLGAGHVPMLLERFGMQVTTVEIDPAVGSVARRIFNFDLPADRVHFMDGRQYLARSGPQFDYIVIDAFSGEQVPWHLTTREALQEAATRLKPGGVLAVNLTSLSGGVDIESLHRTLRSVFRYVRGYAESGGSALQSFEFLASMEPLELSPGFAHRAPGGPQDVIAFLDNPLDEPTAGILLTDDYNPINEQRMEVDLRWREVMREWAGVHYYGLLF